MFNQFLDKDQREVFDVLDAKNYCLVTSKDKEQLSHLIWAAILEQLFNNQGITLSLQDKELKSIILSKLQEYKLESYVFDTDKGGLSSILTSKWAVLAKKDENAPLSQKHSTAFNQIITKASTYLEDRNKAIFGRKSWKQILEIKESRIDDEVENLFLPHYNLDFEFNQVEYWHLKSKIEEAARLWNPLFQQIQAQSLFQKDADLSHPHLRQLILKWKADLQSIKSSIHSYLNQLQDEITQKYLAHFNDAEEILSALPPNLDSIQEKDQKEGRSIFFGQKKSKGLSEWDELLTKIKQNPLFEDLDTNNKNLGLKAAMTIALDSWKSQLQEEVKTRIKRLTRLNIEDEGYKASIDKAKQLFAAINGEQIINFHFEFTAHSLDAQLQYFDEVQSILDRVLWIFTQQDAYLDWHQYCSELSTSEQSLISALIKKEDNHWLELFEQWYICALVEVHYSPHFQLDHDDQLGQKILEKGKGYIEEEINNWKIEKNKAIHKGLLSLKKTNKTLFNTFIGKHKPEELLHPDQVSLFCPILLGTHPSQHLLISDYPVKKLEGQKHIELTTEEWIDGGIYLEGGFSNHEPIANLPLSNRLSKVKALASNLRYFSTQNRIFILKDKTIITCLSDLSNRRFLDYRKEQIVKEIHLGSDPIERITEYLLLNDLPCEIWIDSFVIQEESPSSILIQLQLIQSLKQAGYWMKTKMELDKELIIESQELIQQADNHPNKEVRVETVN